MTGKDKIIKISVANFCFWKYFSWKEHSWRWCFCP